jgi:hypothetical protein
VNTAKIRLLTKIKMALSETLESAYTHFQSGHRFLQIAVSMDLADSMRLQGRDNSAFQNCIKSRCGKCVAVTPHARRLTFNL